MPVDGWRERHGTCQFGTYRPAEAEGLLEAVCANPGIGERYSERFCACECPVYRARAGRMAQGRIPSCAWSDHAAANDPP